MAPRIRSASLAGYMELTHSLGLPARRLLEEAGIDVRALTDPEAFIDVAAVRRVLEATAAESGLEDFGLRLVASRRLSNLGPISLVLREEPTGRAALETLCRHMRLLNESLLTRVEDHDGLVIIREEILFGRPGAMRQSIELAVGVLFRILRELLGPAWEPRQVAFTHRAPRDKSTHLKVFGRFVSFDADFNGIVCAAADLDRPIAGTDPAMANIARRYLDSLRLTSSDNTRDRVRQLVIAMLPGGRCTIERAALHFDVNRRTLHRHLAAEGQTFSGLVAAVRRELAERHIREGGRTLTDIADLLGFSAVSAFSRWFHGVYGMSVTEWKKTLPSADTATPRN